ncbi:hypothetical protein D9613_007583 [Agrocybe pediades]|uniref:Uncharacterized protein n=1 Tax=Agrocybe pediades TaxID=84607 RepID=A0A8H4QNI7_9AGAR|nr:hypothetical protein D9613_007583 [Agrocybe pediades]
MYLLELMRPLPACVIGASRGAGNDALQKQKKDALPRRFASVRTFFKSDSKASSKAIDEDSKEMMDGLPELPYEGECHGVISKVFGQE